MPIGKNSIKRVANNGYSSVKSDAPDMENSTVIANPSPEVVEKMLPKSDTPKKTAPKKTTANSTQKVKSTTAKKPASTTAKKTQEAKKDTEAKSFVNVGKDLPVYLL